MPLHVDFLFQRYLIAKRKVQDEKDPGRRRKLLVLVKLFYRDYQRERGKQK